MSASPPPTHHDVADTEPPRPIPYSDFERDVDALLNVSPNEQMTTYIRNVWGPHMKATIKASFWDQFVIPGPNGRTGQVGVQNMRRAEEALQTRQIVNPAQLPSAETVCSYIMQYPPFNQHLHPPSSQANNSGHEPQRRTSRQNDELARFMRRSQNVISGGMPDPFSYTHPNYRSLGSTAEIGRRAAAHYGTTAKRWKAGRAFI